MRPPQASVSRGERGQILVFMALAIMFVITGVMAISVDVGVAEVSKRRLQTVADAAALAAATEKSKGGTDAAALQKARDMITDSGIVPPASNTGSGPTLTEGIQVGSDIRVALRRTVGTYFANIFGVGEVTVSARAHARSASEGVLPIAIKRFSEGNTGVLIPTAPDNDGTIRDYLAPANADVITAWPSPLTDPPATSAGFSPLSAYNPNVSGRSVPILGHDAQANQSQSSEFHFWVAPDVRDVDDQYPNIIPPVQPGDNAQSTKDIASKYFSMKGYPGPFAPPWTTMAILNGVDAGQTIDPISEVFNPGDVVTAMIYDGSARKQPDFDLVLSPISPSPAAGDINVAGSGTPASYTVTIHQTDTDPWEQYVSPSIQLSVHGFKKPDMGPLVNWGSWQLTGGAFSDSDNDEDWNEGYDAASPGGGDVSVNLYILHDNDTRGTRSFQVRAYDPANQRIKMTSGTVFVGGSPWNQAYTASSTQAFQSAKAGDGNVDFTVRLDSHNGYHPTVQVGPVGMPGPVPNDPVRWCAPSSDLNSPEPNCLIAGPTNVTLSVLGAPVNLNTASKTFTVRADVGAGASQGECLIKVPMWDGVKRTWDDSAPNPSPDVQYLYLSLFILPDTEFGNFIENSDFVHILGYANFVIHHWTSNSLYGYAVSGLVDHPEKLGLGMRPRLVGWFQ